ncbi:Metallo-hydrolase/oxidoreductase [Fomitopsis serialis]|uniref:Metallo-hydrolase/oxidoreductase n=1 Tax=Fomitopsis serialis TaxID=139415 RepID=UPI002007A5D0|nr:Metallo-hydrolase/oxidoreductase [Neoantrodia serialis]KAH9928619.1 Metallo-hydrolase/oxidoreductase [Neoantrodia serialis]
MTSRAAQSRRNSRHTLRARKTTTKEERLQAYRLTHSTFLIVEIDDVYSEHPYIYVKLITSLRAFLESVPVEENGGRPLNERARMRYVVALSHCHYDHILGVEQFASDSPVLQSSYAPAFVSRSALPAHSLCTDLGIRTPQFASVLVPHNTMLTSASGVPLGMTLLHTPGHTPDEIALWDAHELMLYVGDTVYEWEAIIFPAQGDIKAWLTTIDELVAVVMSSRVPEAVRINCGHRTVTRPALEVLGKAKQFVMDVLVGDVEVRWRMWRRGEWYVEYRQEGGQFSVRCPERLIEEARQQ